MKHSNLHFFLIFSLLLSLFSSSCEKEEQHPVPDVYVNFIINLQDDPEFYSLRFQGASVTITRSTIGALSVGYNDNGIIIYNAGDGEFYAFDRTCPHDMPESIAVESDGNNLAICPQCGSKYVFPSMGAPSLDSPAKWPLKTYHAFYNPNTGDLKISN